MRPLVLFVLLAACTVRSERFLDRDAAGVADAVAQETVEVPAGDLQGPITWRAGTVYVLRGPVFVMEGTLRIESGATIRGDRGSALVITKGARIEAVGTAAAPIVFTSNASSPRPGDWTGVVLLGESAVMTASGTAVVEGFDPALADRLRYGGSQGVDECGELRYVRIEYGGGATSEVGALTIGGCLVTLDFVQIHRSADDGLALRGGFAVPRHIVVTQAHGDAIDWDLGWVGNFQFLVTQQREGFGARAINGDSPPIGPGIDARGGATITNATFVGSNGAAHDPQGGIELTHRSMGLFSNTIIMGFPQFACDFDTTAAADYGIGVSVMHTYFERAAAASAVWPPGFDGTPPGDDGFDEAAEIGASPSNHIDEPVGLTDPYAIASPSWKPVPGSPVMACGIPTPPFDETATFCGAIGRDDWTAGWTRYGD